MSSFQIMTYLKNNYIHTSGNMYGRSDTQHWIAFFTGPGRTEFHFCCIQIPTDIPVLTLLKINEYGHTQFFKEAFSINSISCHDNMLTQQWPILLEFQSRFRAVLGQATRYSVTTRQVFNFLEDWVAQPEQSCSRSTVGK